ncbi:hypothetical protein AQJ46_27295 [Streptomyces canus]|uniref:Uncharacterized protein n=1 Tax=Streptomyces canus TaxID=58343 RepID=A0A101RZY0_9ACTN|nr:MULTISPECIES: hypothetical protein [Streptomyces]KUN64835.1 hypothetical protein AQJ46_27295 [Streptomyces canus]MDI5906714.1 hypothetical protein [Streptomyces sp. 12257]
MTTTPSPRGWELLFVMAGALAAMAGTTAAFVTHEQAWRYLIAAGCFAQFLGWVRHGRRLRGGAR